MPKYKPDTDHWDESDDAPPEWKKRTSATIEVEVYRCGGCERVFDRPHKYDPRNHEEYETPRCPRCGTKINNDETVVKTVAF